MNHDDSAFERWWKNQNYNFSSTKELARAAFNAARSQWSLTQAEIEQIRALGPETESDLRALAQAETGTKNMIRLLRSVLKRATENEGD